MGLMRQRVVAGLLGLTLLVAGACSGGGGGGGGGDTLTTPPADTTPDEIILFSPTEFLPASVVLGQADFVSNEANRGGLVAADTMSQPAGNPVVHDGLLLIADYSNNRVLGFSSIPTTNGTAANFAVGASGLASGASNTAADLFSQPEGLAIGSDGKFYVDDRGNSRMLIFDSVPTAAGTSATTVVGHSLMTESLGGCSSTAMKVPEGAVVAGGKLLVADTSNHRVLIWNTIPTGNDVAADVVLGQVNFDFCASNDQDGDGISDTATASTLNYPYDVWSDGTRLAVADGSNARVLLWDTIPTTNGVAADHVLGQPDFVTTDEDADQAFLGPVSVTSNGTQLLVGDCDKNRVLVWDSYPTGDYAPADHVVGQSDFAHVQANDDNQDDAEDANSSARTFQCPWGLHVSGTQLLVMDYQNNRFLIFDGE